MQFTVKHEQTIDCGGGYVKLFPASLDQKDMHGDSEYNIMFGEGPRPLKLCPCLRRGGGGQSPWVETGIPVSATRGHVRVLPHLPSRVLGLWCFEGEGLWERRVGTLAAVGSGH